MATSRGSKPARGGGGAKRSGSAPKRAGGKPSGSKRSGPPRKGAKSAGRPTGGRRPTNDRNEAPRSWGGVARRGARRVHDEEGSVRGGATKRSGGGAGGASQAWRQAVDAKRPDRAKEPRVPKDLETWVLVEEIRDEAEHAVERATTAPTQRERDQHAKKRA